jgi:hypothetical protein
MEVSLPVLVCNLLFHIMKVCSHSMYEVVFLLLIITACFGLGYMIQDKKDWPTDSIKVFLDDSLYSRAWVDHELCQLFASNVKTILDPPAPTENSGSSNSLVTARFHDSAIFEETRTLIVTHLRRRLEELEKERLGAIGSVGGNNNSVRNMILTLLDLTSIPDARVLAAENLESWLHNAFVKAQAKELLTKVVSVRF